LVSENRNGILTHASKDDNFKVWTDMRVNVDFTYHQPVVHLERIKEVVHLYDKYSYI